MGKRKTLKQKIRSQERKQQVSENSVSQQVSSSTLSYTFQPSNVTSRPVTQSATPAYISHDLIKTGIISSAIVVAQLALFLLLKNHILALPFVRY